MRGKHQNTPSRSTVLSICKGSQAGKSESLFLLLDLGIQILLPKLQKTNKKFEKKLANDIILDFGWFMVPEK